MLLIMTLNTGSYLWDFHFYISVDAKTGQETTITVPSHIHLNVRVTKSASFPIFWLPWNTQKVIDFLE